MRYALRACHHGIPPRGAECRDREWFWKRQLRPTVSATPSQRRSLCYGNLGILSKIMRWPIQFQLLLPMLTVVVLAIALASIGSAYLGGRRARQAQEESLSRVVATLTEAWYPPTEPVLRMMAGLSGAEFVLLDRRDSIKASTLPLNADDLKQLRQIHDGQPSSDLAGRPTTSLGGRSYLSQRLAVAAGREPVTSPGSLYVLYPEDRWSALMWQAADPALIAGAVATAAIVLVTTLLAHRFVRPIRQLGDRAAAIARGDFQAAPVWRHDDEIRDLALSINRMAEQLGRYEVQVRRHEQLRTLDQLGAGMAHQLRNAATGGRMAIELHRRECAAGAASEALDVALRQLELMESYLQRFMALGRERPLAAEDVSLSAVVEDALSLVRPACVHAGIELEFVPPSQPLSVRGDAEALRQLTVNLVINAVEAAGRQSKGQAQIFVVLEIAKCKMQNANCKMSTSNPQSLIPNPSAALYVRDTGPGPSPDATDRLFEPFVSGKPEGTGLGLYVARHIVEGHRGSIRWQREDNMTCFTVELPLIPNP
jgi:signal transduction histidine kinase